MLAYVLGAEKLRPIAWTLFRIIVPPVAAFALARMRISRSPVYAGADPSDPHSWARSDSAHYYGIANHGYELFSCARMPGYDPNLQCGNAAWLPGYPLLIRALIGLSLDQDIAGTVISATFALGTLVVLWNFFLEAEVSIAALLTLLLAAFFPGHVYYHAVFPISVCSFFLVSGLAAYTKRQFALAGLAGACAAFTYSSGVSSPRYLVCTCLWSSAVHRGASRSVSGVLRPVSWRSASARSCSCCRLRLAPGRRIS